MPVASPNRRGFKSRRPGPGKVKISTDQQEAAAAAPAAPPVDLPDTCTTDFAGAVPEQQILSKDTLETIVELGRGAYGVVERMRHTPTGKELAIKRIRASFNDEEQRRLVLELQANMMTGKCPFLVLCYGAIFRDGDVWIAMEMMDASLDKFYKACVDLERPRPEELIRQIAFCTCTALNYMKHELKLMHRDVKPSNMLANRHGVVKICDFGISGHLTNSLAKTVNAGCKPYLAPERIDGDNKAAYTAAADVWSLGISLIEVSVGVHPYAKWKTPFEQLKQVVVEPPPTCPESLGYSPEFHTFIAQCLRKDFSARPKYPNLLDDPWLRGSDGQGRIDQPAVATFIGETLDILDEQKRSVLGDSVGSS